MLVLRNIFQSLRISLFSNCAACATIPGHFIWRIFFCTNHFFTVYICDVCDDEFATEDLMKDHKDQLHLKARKFACDVCDKKFRTEKFLLRHKSMVHEYANNRTYTCSSCDETFLHEAHYWLHRKFEYLVNTLNSNFFLFFILIE